VLDRWLLNPHGDRVPSSNLAHPFIALERSKRLGNGFTEGFRRHFDGVLVSVRVFAGYSTGPHGHVRYFRLLFASAQAQPTAVRTVISAIDRSVRSKAEEI